MATCREPLGLELMAERLGAERPQGRTTGMRIDSEGHCLTKKAGFAKDYGLKKQTRPPRLSSRWRAGTTNFCMRSQVQGSPFRVIFLSVRRTQTALLLTLLICQQVLDMPARALTPICFFNHALNSPNNLFFPYILRSRMAGG